MQSTSQARDVLAHVVKMCVCLAEGSPPLLETELLNYVTAFSVFSEQPVGAELVANTSKETKLKRKRTF